MVNGELRMGRTRTNTDALRQKDAKETKVFTPAGWPVDPHRSITPTFHHCDPCAMAVGARFPILPPPACVSPCATMRTRLTTMTLKWKAKRLNIGAAGSWANLLRRAERQR